MAKGFGLAKIRMLSVLSAVLIFSSCSEKENVKLPVMEDYDASVMVAERKELRLGIVKGPYGAMFMETIQPLLAEKGYTVELVYYDNYSQPNFALANEEINLNMFQHYTYLNKFKFEHDLSLSAIAEIPTASMGIYSSSYESLEDLEDGAVAAIPEDATNRSRALIVLEAAGVITIDRSVDKSKADENDLAANPKNIQFVPIEAEKLVKSLDSYDLAAINGNYAISGGLDLSDALYNEVLAENYINVIVVRTEDLSRQYVRDIIEIVNSDEYRGIITDANGKYSGFQRPRRLLNNN